MVKTYRVIWDKVALGQLKEAYQYIRKDSLQNAQKVKRDILAKVASLSDHPARYGADKLRMDHDTRFRAFELHHYRVAYYINEASAEVIILRIRHTSQEPLGY